MAKILLIAAAFTLSGCAHAKVPFGNLADACGDNHRPVAIMEVTHG